MKIRHRVATGAVAFLLPTGAAAALTGAATCSGGTGVGGVNREAN
ncbi:hypothetical protein [Streptomyces sp. NPDC053427]